jgi:lysine-specific demethylase 8
VEIVQCLHQAGFLGNENDDDDDDSEEGEEIEEENVSKEGQDSTNQGVEEDDDAVNDNEDNDMSTSTENENATVDMEALAQQYSVQDIEQYLAQRLFIDEDSSVCDAAVAVTTATTQEYERDAVGDDLDYVFPPFDGTAMYYMACKMNHSCDPNVIVLYKRGGWGQQYPLAAYCIAYKDIVQGEELTISYIESGEPLAQRQQDLANYGFTCTCPKCIAETKESSTIAINNNSSVVKTDPQPTHDLLDDLFGKEEDTDDDEDQDEAMKEKDDNDDAYVQHNNDPSSTTRPEEILTIEQRVERLDSAVNHSKFGSRPLEMLGKVASYVLSTGKHAVTASTDDNQHAKLPQHDMTIQTIWNHCSNGIQERDFVMCKIGGYDLEDYLYTMLQRDTSWPSMEYRTLYGCACVTVAVGLSHECSFVRALSYLDKALILGLPRYHDLLCDFFAYVECHALQLLSGPYSQSYPQQSLPSFVNEADRVQLEQATLSNPIQHAIVEGGCQMSYNDFVTRFVAPSVPVVLRGYASQWPCIHSWRNMKVFRGHHGHRLVPIEVGTMMRNHKIQERIVSLRTFVDDYLATPSSSLSSNNGTDPTTTSSLLLWSLDDAIAHVESVAYMAQHPLTDQIPALRNEINERPDLCGGPDNNGGPSHVYFWFGTGGTRTPLHFDSYENLFVQVVGIKYIRLYDVSETPYLYVDQEQSGYGLQGNMSSIDCEREDWDIHPLAQHAKFQEVVLYPGDALYIPRRTWHYIRSLTTSISINYWF